jgi:hypothetical protein
MARAIAGTTVQTISEARRGITTAGSEGPGTGDWIDDRTSATWATMQQAAAIQKIALAMVGDMCET